MESDRGQVPDRDNHSCAIAHRDRMSCANLSQRLLHTPSSKMAPYPLEILGSPKSGIWSFDQIWGEANAMDLQELQIWVSRRGASEDAIIELRWVGRQCQKISCSTSGGSRRRGERMTLYWLTVFRISCRLAFCFFNSASKRWISASASSRSFNGVRSNFVTSVIVASAGASLFLRRVPRWGWCSANLPYSHVSTLMNFKKGVELTYRVLQLNSRFTGRIKERWICNQI
jgi:hypothetical protein